MNAPVDIAHFDLRRRHPLDVKERISEGRREKRVLEHHGHDHHEPELVEAEALGNGQENREGDHHDPHPVDEKAEDEGDEHHHDEGAPLSQAQSEKKPLDDPAAADPHENPRKAGGPDDDGDDHGGSLGRPLHRLVKPPEGEPAVGHDHHQGEECPDARGFGGRGHPGEDRPQDPEDQDQGRNQGLGGPNPDPAHGHGRTFRRRDRRAGGRT